MVQTDAFYCRALVSEGCVNEKPDGFPHLYIVLCQVVIGLPVLGVVDAVASVKRVPVRYAFLDSTIIGLLGTG